MIRKENKGFTLIEILIVVAIIAILASVVLVGLGPTQQAGRDTRRIADIRETQTAVELYYNKCGYYPGTAQAGAVCVAGGAPGAAGAVTWANLTTALTGSAIGITAVPNDPNAAGTYLYGVNAGGSSYVMGATLEQPSNKALQNDVDGTVFTINCADAPAAVYCVQL